MTRLVESDIDAIEKQLYEYEKIFIGQTGHTMEEIAKIAIGISGTIKKRKTSVIPVRGGLGIIKGFSEAVGSIVRHCQVETVVMDEADVTGLRNTYLSDCEISFLADDDVFGAFGIGSRVFSDNGDATGKGFAAALTEAMKKNGIDPKGQEILIVGCGPVGKAAAEYISKEKAVPVLYDIDREKAEALTKTIENSKIAVEPVIFENYKYIFDASTSGDFITKKDVAKDTIISVPGMPCGVTKDAAEIATVIHNPLELGTITMYFDCLKQLEV